MIKKLLAMLLCVVMCFGTMVPASASFADVLTKPAASVADSVFPDAVDDDVINVPSNTIFTGLFRAIGNIFRGIAKKNPQVTGVTVKDGPKVTLKPDGTGATYTVYYFDSAVTGAQKIAGHTSMPDGKDSGYIVVITSDGFISKATKVKYDRKYTVRFDANGGSGAPSQMTGSGSVKIPSKVPARTGMKFLGWSTNRFDTVGRYKPGSAIKIASNTVLYAVWEAVVYTIFYDPGIDDPEIYNKVINMPDPQEGNGKIVLSAKVPVIAGTSDKVFIGWSDGVSGQLYGPGYTYTLTSDAVLTAVWGAAETHSVTFKQGTGVFGNNMPSNLSCATLDLNDLSVPAKEYHMFAGWQVTDGIFYEYNPGTGFENNLVSVTKDMELTAVWKTEYVISVGDEGYGKGFGIVTGASGEPSGKLKNLTLYLAPGEEKEVTVKTCRAEDEFGFSEDFVLADMVLLTAYLQYNTTGLTVSDFKQVDSYTYTVKVSTTDYKPGKADLIFFPEFEKEEIITEAGGAPQVTYKLRRYWGYSTGVTIPDYISEIGDYAFEANNRIHAVGIGTGEHSLDIAVGYRAFYQCENLTNVTLGPAVTEIKDEAFAECPSLRKVEMFVLDTIAGDDVFANSGSADSGFELTVGYYVRPAGEFSNYEYPPSDGSGNYANYSEREVCVQGGYMCRGANINYLNIGVNVFVEPYVFTGCSGVKMLICETDNIGLYGDDAEAKGNMLPDCETAFIWNAKESESFAVEAYAFYGNSVEYADLLGVTAIEEHAFENCENLDRYVERDLTGNSRYADNDGNLNIMGSALVKSIGDYAFRNTGFEIITIGFYVRTMGAGVFDDCQNLHDVVLRTDRDFEGPGCSKFNNTEELTIVVRGEIIPSYIFSEAKIKQVIFDHALTVTKIGDYAFASAQFSQNTSINVPLVCSSVGKGAFMNSNLRNISFSGSCARDHGSSEDLGVLRSAGCNNYRVDKGPCEWDGTTANVWNNGYYDHKTGTTKYMQAAPPSYAGCYDDNGNPSGHWELLFFNENSEKTTYIWRCGDHTIFTCNGCTGNNCVVIGKSAFSNCTNLESVSFKGNNDTREYIIGENAFSNVSDNIVLYYYGTQENWNTLVSVSSGNDEITGKINFVTA